MELIAATFVRVVDHTAVYSVARRGPVWASLLADDDVVRMLVTGGDTRSTLPRGRGAPPVLAYETRGSLIWNDAPP